MALGTIEAAIQEGWALDTSYTVRPESGGEPFTLNAYDVGSALLQPGQVVELPDPTPATVSHPSREDIVKKQGYGGIWSTPPVERPIPNETDNQPEPIISILSTVAVGQIEYNHIRILRI